jgi:rubrerythrin
MEILDLVKVLKSNELLLAELYHECQRLFPDHKADFEELQSEEEGHAFLVDQIYQDIKENPDEWKPGKLSLVSAQNVNSRIRETLKEIREGKASSRYAITFAMSMELSMSEKNFAQILVAENPAFKMIFKSLDEGFVHHYSILQKIEKQIFKPGKMGFDDLNRI